jgi:hypothetical protein
MIRKTTPLVISCTKLWSTFFPILFIVAHNKSLLASPFESSQQSLSHSHKLKNL